MSNIMPLNRGRNLQGRDQVVVFRATGGECAWMEISDARQAVQNFPNEWAKEPFNGQTYGAPQDVWFVEVGRGGVSQIERPWGW